MFLIRISASYGNFYGHYELGGWVGQFLVLTQRVLVDGNVCFRYWPCGESAEIEFVLVIACIHGHFSVLTQSVKVTISVHIDPILSLSYYLYHLISPSLSLCRSFSLSLIYR